MILKPVGVDPAGRLVVARPVGWLTTRRILEADVFHRGTPRRRVRLAAELALRRRRPGFTGLNGQIRIAPALEDLQVVAVVRRVERVVEAREGRATPVHDTDTAWFTRFFVSFTVTCTDENASRPATVTDEPGTFGREVSVPCDPANASALRSNASTSASRAPRPRRRRWRSMRACRSSGRSRLVVLAQAAGASKAGIRITPTTSSRASNIRACVAPQPSAAASTDRRRAERRAGRRDRAVARRCRGSAAARATVGSHAPCSTSCHRCFRSRRSYLPCSSCSRPTTCRCPRGGGAASGIAPGRLVRSLGRATVRPAAGPVGSAARSTAHGDRDERRRAGAAGARRALRRALFVTGRRHRCGRGEQVLPLGEKVGLWQPGC